jgi:hypothetical protein
VDNFLKGFQICKREKVSLNEVPSANYSLLLILTLAPDVPIPPTDK